MTSSPPDKLWLLWHPEIGSFPVDERDLPAARDTAGTNWSVVGPYHLDPVASLIADDCPCAGDCIAEQSGEPDEQAICKRDPVLGREFAQRFPYADERQ